MQGRQPAHRNTNDMGLVDSQAVQHRTNVVARPLLRILLLVVGDIGWRIAACVVSDTSIAAGKIPDLRLVAAMVAAKFMHKYDGESFTRLFVIEFDAVVGSNIRHNRSPELVAQLFNLRPSPSGFEALKKT